MAVGVALGIVATLALPLSRFSLLPWVAIHIGMIAPTVVQPWFQRKAYKMGARTLLGVGTATWLTGMFLAARSGLPRWFEVGTGVIVFGALARALLVLRDRRTSSPCGTCSLGVYPTCRWNLPRLLASAGDPQLAEALRWAVPRIAVGENGAISREPG